MKQPKKTGLAKVIVLLALLIATALIHSCNLPGSPPPSGSSGALWDQFQWDSGSWG